MTPTEARNRAYELVLDGLSVRDILATLGQEGAKKPGDALSAALRRIADAPAEEHLGWCIEAARNLVRLHLDADEPDLGGALRALQELARLTNSYETARRERGDDTPSLGKGEGGETDDPKRLLDLVRGGG